MASQPENLDESVQGELPVQGSRFSGEQPLSRHGSIQAEPPLIRPRSILSEDHSSQHFDESAEPRTSLGAQINTISEQDNNTVPRDSLELPSHDNAITPEEKLPVLMSPWKRLGLTGFAILIPGSLAMIGIMAFLSLLWREAIVAAGGGQPKKPWVGILNFNRAGTAVTLCTAALRIIIVFQASLTTAMVASIALEKTGVPFLQAPLYSFTRALNSGPTSLLPTLWSRPRSRGSAAIYGLVLLQLAVVISSQLLSTVLLLDVSSQRLIGHPRNTTITTRLSSDGSGRTQPIPGYTFAERPGSYVRGLGFEDTGDTYRAFLPFGNETDRTALRSFEGIAGVVNMRVVCFQPQLKDLRLATTGSQIPGELNVLRGSFDLDDDTAQKLFHRPGLTKSFNCNLPSAAFSGDEATCRASCDTPVLELDEDPEHQPDFTPLSDRLELLPMYVIIDTFTPGGDAAWSFLRNPIRIPLSQDNDENSKGRSWATISNFPGVDGPSPSMNITICLSDRTTLLFNTRMERSWHGFETSMAYERHNGTWSTDASRRQLGASQTPEPLKARGLLELVSWENISKLPSLDELWWDPRTYQRSIDVSGGGITDALADVGEPSFVGNAIELGNAPPDIRRHDQETGSVALALQALHTMFSQQVFYESLAEATYDHTVLASFARPALVPGRWLGVILAAVLVTLQISLVCAIATYFLMRTRVSAVDNSWQTLAQMVSDSTMPVLEQANTMTDEEVKGLVQEQLGKEMAKGSGVLRYRGGRVGFEPQ